MEKIKQLIEQYKEKIAQNEKEIPEIKALSSRQMTLDVKNVQISARQLENRTLNQVILDLESIVMERKYLIVKDEQGYCRLLGRDGDGKFDIVIDKVLTNDKVEAERIFRGKGLMTD